MYEQIIQSPNHFFFSTCNFIGVNDIITKVVVAFLGIGCVVHIFITFLHQLVVFTFDHHNGVKGKIPRCSMRSNFFGEYSIIQTRHQRQLCVKWYDSWKWNLFNIYISHSIFMPLSSHWHPLNGTFPLNYMKPQTIKSEAWDNKKTGSKSKIEYNYYISPFFPVRISGYHKLKLLSNII